MLAELNGRIELVFLININYKLCIQEIGEKLSEIGGRLDYPRLSKELAQEIETLWKDEAIQVRFRK